jgi:molybdate transport system substrate-binding protein
VRVLTAGAFRRTLMDIVPDFERRSGHKVLVEKDTVGALVRRIEGGEPFDLVIASDAAVEGLVQRGRVAPGSCIPLASVGVGVMVRVGTPVLDVSTVEAFREAVLAAASIAYIDPASGGSSGIYIAGLLQRLGIAEAVREKTRLKQGGHVADLIATGEAELGIHQISEILPNTDVVMVGPLPSQIQSTTTYAAGLASDACNSHAAKALLAVLSDPTAAEAMQRRGMIPIRAAAKNNAPARGGRS